MNKDFDSCYRAVRSRDARFDGRFFIGVTSTGIYCRPSCPAMTPKRANARFYRTAAAAQSKGFRACKRCRPDAVPGSPEWNERADLAGRAMRLIADGIVDREGVVGLARRLSYTERHLNRMLTAEVGAGPISLARARRAQTARLLIETTKLPFSEVAFAAGFSSIRQFNETIQEVFASTPSELRRLRGERGECSPGCVSLRLPYRAPCDVSGLLRFLGERAVAGVESFVDGVYRRTLRLPHGAGIVSLSEGEGYVVCDLRLEDLRDLGASVQRCRRLLDLDADPIAVAEALGEDPLLAPLVRRWTGQRVPGSVDGHELAVRAVLGQQVSVAGARTLAGRLVAGWGESLPDSLTGVAEGITHLFPSVEAVAEIEPENLTMPASRSMALRNLARALAEGTVSTDPGADRAESSRGLLELRGIGPWTASYIAMRAHGDPDAFLPTDLGVRHAVAALGGADDPKSIATRAERWRPWRAYATQYLWSSLELDADELTQENREVAS